MLQSFTPGDWLAAVTLLAGGAGWATAMYTRLGRILERIDGHGKSIKDHENRLRKLEARHA